MSDQKKGPDFDTITVKELKQYIRERGVSVSTYKKPELILLENSLHEMNADIDPDLKIYHVLKNLLTLPAGRCVPDLFKMTNMSNDISTLPNFGLMDIYNHLIMSKTEYNKDMLQSWTKVVVTPNPSPRIQCCHVKSQFNIDLGGGVLQHFCPRLSDIRFP